MRLDLLGELRLAYSDEGFMRIRPYGSEEGSGWGDGNGSIEGQQLRGSVRWFNAPHVRSDSTYLPHAHGRIQTHDGATILFLMEGRTPGLGDEQGKQLLRLVLESEDARYAWVNTAFVVAEGIIREVEPGSGRFAMVANVYRCIHEQQA